MALQVRVISWPSRPVVADGDSTIDGGAFGVTASMYGYRHTCHYSYSAHLSLLLDVGVSVCMHAVVKCHAFFIA